ncbi:SoxR reducing system RseC family protein [Winogradskyella vincentii]|uniref:SoxR reducing system RseC family protein n=1 Tax=Winogradskyella vincentii TaxID=2877122 RepID=A0ABS7XXL7_9FLAO|nr:SoxR reducing system RseC family protein [Winogradskyella vincentii]MCA0152106.1 SoxR reducing system RseC family protein [Winogradskyella vincentii]
MNSHQKNKNTFVHAGVISKINSDSVIVTLEQNIQCESCHVKGSCGLSEFSVKQVEVSDSIHSFKINEQVDVILKKALGLKAVFWAYVFPFILMFSTLIITSSFLKEWQAGLISLVVIVPYYYVLYLLKNTLKSAFKISILKI